MTPQEVADAYQDQGFDLIAFTDHDYLLKPETNGIYEKVKSDMILFAGVELTVFVKGYVHVSRISGEKEVLHIFNHLEDYNLTLEQILDRIQALADMFPLETVEITSKGFRCKGWEIPEIPYPKIAADDSHGREGSEGPGSNWMLKEIKIRSSGRLNGEIFGTVIVKKIFATVNTARHSRNQGKFLLDADKPG